MYRKNRGSAAQYWTEALRFAAQASVFAPFRMLFPGKKTKQLAKDTIADFGRAYSDRLCRDMLWKFAVHRISMPEYFLYDCGHKSCKEIRAYIGERELRYWALKLNDSAGCLVLDNKYATYLRFREAYGRKMLLVKTEEAYPEFKAFVLRETRVFIKPVDDSLGNGAALVRVHTDKQAEGLFHYMRRLHPAGFVTEEVIRQCAEMAALHPQSVNTLRIGTIRHRDHVKIWYAFLRVGQGDSVVDNFTRGGLEALIDTESGRTCCCGDKYGNRYEGTDGALKQITGFQIPRWAEATTLVQALAFTMPSVRYIGWDLALTDNGWIVVEANSLAQLKVQALAGRGFKQALKDEIRAVRSGR